jgi:hypothetical protein
VASGDICVPEQRLEIMQYEDCVKFQQLSSNKMIILKRRNVTVSANRNMPFVSSLLLRL